MIKYIYICSLVLGCFAVAGLIDGCATPSPTPPIPYLPQYLNLHRDSGSLALPGYASFDRGACVITGRDAIALAAGPNSLLLCDLSGPNNRCELLLDHPDYLIVYERIGQRPLASADARKILTPVGVKAKASKEYVVATFNLYLQRSERLSYDPRLQRAPEELRLTGNLRLPLVAKDEPLASAILQLESLITDQSKPLTTNLAGDLPAFRKIPLPRLPKLQVFK